MSENNNDAIETGSQSHPLSSSLCVMTPGGTSIESVETLYQVTESGRLTPWRPDTANYTINIEYDSGTDGDNDVDNEDEQENVVVDLVKKQRNTRRLRDYIVQFNEEVEPKVDIAQDSDIENENVMDDRIANVNVLGDSNVNKRGRWATRSKGGAGKSRKSTATDPVDTNFFWSEDFLSFTGQKETYSRVPGPTFSFQDPADIFHEIWDHEFMEMVVKETNTYAWEVISQFSDPDTGTKISEYYESWTDVSVEELYRYFAILILLPLCHRTNIAYYWNTGILGMTGFRKIMTRKRFFLINNFLHFVSNGDLLTMGHDRKIEEVAPILDHCNRKFARMYIPSQYLGLDEFLLLRKRSLSSKHCIRSNAARFGMKSLELCEAETGYLLQYHLYTDKKVEMHPKPLQNHTAKLVLDLIEGYLDVGHVLVMDNWYNQLPLTRYLKTRHTDVLGTLNRRQQEIPQAFKDLTPNDVNRGTSVSIHSGDIALVAYKDVQLVTVISTYHQHMTCLRKRKRQNSLEPAAVEEYNRYKGGVDLKDHKLSMFSMERKPTLKFYMKVFRRLLNTSLLNAFIIYSRNPEYRAYSHHDFRLRVTEGLLSRYPPVSSVPRKVSDTSQLIALRLRPGNHFPVFTEVVPGDAKGKRRQLRCVRCTALKRRTVVTVRCEFCQVPLCLGPCWKEYHTVLDLKSSES